MQKVQRNYYVEDLNFNYYNEKTGKSVKLPNVKIKTDFGIVYRFNYSIESFVNFLGVKRNQEDKDRTGRNWNYNDFIKLIELAKDEIGDMSLNVPFAIKGFDVVIILNLGKCQDETGTYILDIKNVLYFSDKRKIHINEVSEIIDLAI